VDPGDGGKSHLKNDERRCIIELYETKTAINDCRYKGVLMANKLDMISTRKDPSEGPQRIAWVHEPHSAFVLRDWFVADTQNVL
jgi:hypothetical protein